MWGNILYISAYKGCHIHVYECLSSSATNITEDARSKIVDAQLTFIFRMWIGHMSIFIIPIKAAKMSKIHLNVPMSIFEH